MKVQAGEVVGGADIVIPLSGLHAVAGTVTALADGHALGRGTVRLLYADDREKARETSILDDGSFSLQYIAEGKYILAVSGAQDAEQKAAAEASKTAYQAKLAGAGYGAITTEILDAPPFYYAEDTHQQYLAKNPDGYCGLGGTGVSCPIGLGAEMASNDAGFSTGCW